MRRALIILVLALAGLSGTLTSASGGALAQAGIWTDAPITNGPCVAPSPSYCLLRTDVRGAFTVAGFVAYGGRIYAYGLADGDARLGTAGWFSFADQPLTLPVTGIDATCERAVLTLGGSEPPSPPTSYEPLPEVFTFTVERPGGGTYTSSVGLLETALEVTGSRRLCRLARLVRDGKSGSALEATLNQLAGGGGGAAALSVWRAAR